MLAERANTHESSSTLTILRRPWRSFVAGLRSRRVRAGAAHPISGCARWGRLARPLPPEPTGASNEDCRHWRQAWHL